MQITRYARILFAFIFFVVTAGCNSFDPANAIKYTLAMDIGEYIRQTSNNAEDSMLNEAIRAASAAKETIGKPFAALFGDAYRKMNPGSLSALFVKDGQNDFTVNEADEAVISKLTDKVSVAVKRTCDVMKMRLQKAADNWQFDYNPKKEVIEISISGKQDRERLRKLFNSTGNLQFYETYINEEVAPMLIGANDTLAATLRKENDPIYAGEDEELKKVTENNDTGSLDGYVAKENVMNGDKSTRRKYPLLSVMAPNINSTNEYGPGPVVGYVDRKDTGKLRKYLGYKSVKAILPPDIQFVLAAEDPARADKSDLIVLYAVKVPQSDSTILNSSCITGARADINDYNKMPCVRLEMDVNGAIKWRHMTAHNVGRFIAVVYDGRVYSCPRVDNEISSGNTEISGSFTMEQAQDYANILSSGKALVPVHLVAEGVADPSKGK